MAKGKKDSIKKQEPLQLRKQDIPKNAKCLTDCEAAQILQTIQDHMVVLSKDPTFKIHESFGSGLQYAKAGAPYTNPQSVRRVLETLIPYGVSDGEISVIANVCPETVEEVFALVPSLKV
ncbi:hypothetical protein HS088_TW21G00666 [Tripterygium wilfordii]|uniref:RNA polymerase Rpb4/RPC9 core domain-containing protein n=1 Tax=Tripterygium wilfordii TaxID=458696 RepID=A0A7J7C330_TRIWF|nr:hypothetical protein HS088_TW21G00666 [Tripterygium wilfordii]